MAFIDWMNVHICAPGSQAECFYCWCFCRLHICFPVVPNSFTCREELQPCASSQLHLGSLAQGHLVMQCVSNPLSPLAYSPICPPPPPTRLPNPATEHLPCCVPRLSQQPPRYLTCFSPSLHRTDGEERRVSAGGSLPERCPPPLEVTAADESRPCTQQQEPLHPPTDLPRESPPSPATAAAAPTSPPRRCGCSRDPEPPAVRCNMLVPPRSSYTSAGKLKNMSHIWGLSLL